MKEKLKKIITKHYSTIIIATVILFVIMLAVTFYSKKDNALGAIITPNFWKLSSNILSPISSNWTVNLPTTTFTSVTVNSLTATSASIGTLSVSVAGTVLENLQVHNSGRTATTSIGTGISTFAGDLRTSNNEVYFNSSTGAFDVSYLRTGNLNFEDNAGLVGTFNMGVSTTAATPMGIRMIGFNDEYLIGSYTEAGAGGTIDYSKLRLGFFPELPWGGLNNLGGWNLLATTTQTVGTATATLYTFGLGATSSMGFTCAITASDISTNTSSYYRLIFAAKRSNSGVVTQVGANSITAFEDDATWNAFTSTTATGIAINVVGGAATTSWKGACEMIKIEP